MISNSNGKVKSIPKKISVSPELDSKVEKYRENMGFGTTNQAYVSLVAEGLMSKGQFFDIERHLLKQTKILIAFICVGAASVLTALKLIFGL